MLDNSLRFTKLPISLRSAGQKYQSSELAQERNINFNYLSPLTFPHEILQNMVSIRSDKALRSENLGIEKSLKRQAERERADKPEKYAIVPLPSCVQTKWVSRRRAVAVTFTAVVHNEAAMETLGTHRPNNINHEVNQLE